MKGWEVAGPTRVPTPRPVQPKPPPNNQRATHLALPKLLLNDLALHRHAQGALDGARGLAADGQVGGAAATAHLCARDGK